MSCLEKIYTRLIEEVSVQVNPALDAVKYRDMPMKDWYVSSRHDDWYYHTPRINLSNINLKFLSATLDPCLRDLAMAMNNVGIQTLPSCQGHYFNEKHYENVYDNLLKDSLDIRDQGLIVYNVETEDPLLIQDKNWRLPWGREEFKKSASGSAGRPEGYLGFKLNQKNYPSELFRLIANNISGVRFEENADKSGAFRVYTGDNHSQCETWKVLTGAVLSFL